MSNSFNIQVDDVYSGRHVLISEVNPCSEVVPLEDESEDIDPPKYYYLELEGGLSHTAGKTVANFVLGNGGTDPSWVADELIGKILLCLDGPYRSKCYTITDNDNAKQIEVEGDQETGDAPLVVGKYYTIIHTAGTMYTHCESENLSCISITTESIKWTNGSTEKPKSYADHTTLRPGTGKFRQGVVMGSCDMWDRNPLTRIWKMDQINELIYHWHKINNNKPVYLIITTEYTIGGVTYYQNKNFLYKFEDDNMINGRGYLKGYPMKSDGTMEFGMKFGLNFAEAWFDI